MTHNTYSLSVVVPVYNSAACLPLLASRLHGEMSKLGVPWELILVNDGSTDDSWQIIERLAADHHWIRGINLMRNYGQHNALLCGIRMARYEITITMDDDLQNPPEEIGKLLDQLAKGFDVVYGTPHKQQHGFWRDMASWITKLALQSAMGAKTARRVSAFRAFRTSLRDAFQAYRSPFVSIDVLLTWASTRFSAVTVRHDPRPLGQSNYTFRQLVTHALNMATGFSVLPLQIASVAGFAFMFFGIGVLVYVLGRYLLQGASVPGFAFLACITAIFSGTQLFALGVIGEYLARMHFRTMERPAYAIRAVFSKPE